MLNATQIEQYREHGAIVVPGVADADMVSRMNAVLAGLVEKSRGVAAHDDVYDLEPGHTSEAPRVRRIKAPHRVHPVFAEFLRSEKLLSILQALLGHNVRLYNSKLNLKVPHFGSPVEWHQDWAFHPHTNDDVLAIGVMLDDTTVENGAMYVIPGTHKGPTLDHHGADGFFCGAIDPDNCGIDFSKAVACEGPAGSCSFHHVRLVHGSAQNVSDRSRGLLLYEVAAADAYPLLKGVTDYGDFNKRMLCGEDSNVPRMRDVPLRMPLPPPRFPGSIYETQNAGKRYFGFVDAGGKKSVAP